MVLDIRDKVIRVSDQVAFTYRVWDNVNRLQVAEVIEVGIDRIKVSFIEEYYRYSDITSTHSIRVKTARTTFVKECVLLD